jgi:hypothetical protein
MARQHGAVGRLHFEIADDLANPSRQTHGTGDVGFPIHGFGADVNSSAPR